MSFKCSSKHKSQVKFKYLFFLSEMKAFTIVPPKSKGKLCLSRFVSFFVNLESRIRSQFAEAKSRNRALICRLPKVCKISVLCTFHVPWYGLCCYMNPPYLLALHQSQIMFFLINVFKVINGQTWYWNRGPVRPLGSIIKVINVSLKW